MTRIDESEGGLDSFSQAYKYYGIHIQQDNSVIAREWAPGAKELYLTGDFSKFTNNSNNFNDDRQLSITV
jgi:1,4-alpha-glucan branching enzyme